MTLANGAALRDGNLLAIAKYTSAHAEVTGMKLRIVWAAALAACAGLLPARGQTLSVTPTQVMDDQAAAIRVTGLQPGQHATLRADLTDGEKQPWSAEAGSPPTPAARWT